MLSGLLCCHNPQPDEPTEPPVRAAFELDRYALATETRTQPVSAPAGVPVALPTSPGHIAPATRRLIVLEPSQGRPAILKPGDSFYFVMRVPGDLGKQMFIWLVHSVVPELKVPLESTTPMTTVRRDCGALVLRVPQAVADGLYDIEVRGVRQTFYSRHSVKIVAEPKTKFRIVHLSNMNIDDPSAPEFDELLIDEINLLAPEFIVATGDFTDWGRALDTPVGWTRVLTFLAKINAPAYLLCGDHDHEASFTRIVANSPLGTFDYGGYHGILLLDHSKRLLDKDELKWLVQDLADHKDSTFSFILTHNDDLSVLDQLREATDLPKLVKDGKLRMIITGGHTDWDYREFAAKLAGLDGLEYIRTHQSSTCLRDGSTGVSHYRVIEVDGDRISYIYPDDNATENKQHSIAVGRLRVFYDGPNDGTQPRVTATVQNALNQPFDDCRVWLKVARSVGERQRPPDVAGGRLIAAHDGGKYWACEIAVDLPDKGGVRVMAATDGPPPEPVNVAVAIDGDRNLTFTERQTEFGIKYWQAPGPLALKLTNRGAGSITARPIVRLNGDVLPIAPTYADRWPAKIAAGQTVAIPLELILGRVSEGEHVLQVFFLEDPLKRLSRFPVILSKAR